MDDLSSAFHKQVSTRLDAIQNDVTNGRLNSAIDLFASTIKKGAVIQCFGTGHSEAFSMEISGRAGGFIPTNRIALRDPVLFGDLPSEFLIGGLIERNADIVEQIWAASPIHAGDLFVIASNSGINGSIVGMALLAKAKGHPVIAVTSMDHTMKVEPKHPSGKRLCDIADVTIDNHAPFGDATLEFDGSVRVGAVSSITAAYIAQLLTLGAAAKLIAEGSPVPIYLSGNIPGGDEHNHKLEALYNNRIRRSA